MKDKVFDALLTPSDYYAVKLDISGNEILFLVYIPTFEAIKANEKPVKLKRAYLPSEEKLEKDSLTARIVDDPKTLEALYNKIKKTSRTYYPYFMRDRLCPISKRKVSFIR